MAKKITELPELAELTGADLFLVVDDEDGSSKKISAENVQTFLSGSLQSSYNGGATIVTVDGSPVAISRAGGSSPVLSASLSGALDNTPVATFECIYSNGHVRILGASGEVKLYGSKIGGDNGLEIIPDAPAGLGASGRSVSVTGGKGGPGDGTTLSGPGGDVFIRAGIPGDNGGFGFGEGGNVFIGAPSENATPGASKANIVLWTGGKSAPFPVTNGAISLKAVGKVEAYGGSGDTDAIRLDAYDPGGAISLQTQSVERVRITQNGMVPGTDNTRVLGNSSLRWQRANFGPGSLATPAVAIADDNSGFIETTAVGVSGIGFVHLGNLCGLFRYDSVNGDGQLFAAGGTVTAPGLAIGSFDKGFYRDSGGWIVGAYENASCFKFNADGLLPATDGGNALGKIDVSGGGQHLRFSKVATQEIQVASELIGAGGVTSEGPGVYRIRTGVREYTGSPTAIFSLPVVPEAMYFVRSRVIAYDSTNDDRFFFDLSVYVQRNSLGAGGDITLGTTVNHVTQSENPNVSCTYELNGNTLELRINDAGGTLSATFTYTVEYQLVDTY